MPCKHRMRDCSGRRVSLFGVGLATQTPAPAYALPAAPMADLAVWCDAQFSGSLWQSNTRVGAATAAGHPVGAWDDLSGNGRHARQPAGADRPALAVGTANEVSYDGSLDRLDVADDAGLRPGTSAFTLGVWFKTANANLNRPLVTKRSTSPFNLFYFGVGTVDSSGVLTASKKIVFTTFSLSPSNTSQFWNTDNDVIDGNWHHVFVVRQADGTPLVYVDGSPVAVTAALSSGGATNVTNTVPLSLGYDGITTYLLGSLGEVLYRPTGAATEVEIADHYAATAGGYAA